MSGAPRISIVIRAKNEEERLSSCLTSVRNQSEKNIEIILVDNLSTDRTREIAKNFDCRIITIKEFLPGKAINEGIRIAQGDLIAILSGYCIPADNHWLTALADNFNDQTIAGVYGRQLPTQETSPEDKRDLLITFGLDKKIQIRENFFHNANSMLRRDVRQKMPFDETVTTIEDRLWAKTVQQQGYKIIYEPDARVYHYHGIHQRGNADRLEKTIKVLENIVEFNSEAALDRHLVESSGQKVLAIMSVKSSQKKILQERPEDCDTSFFEYVLDQILASVFLDRFVLCTRDIDLIRVAQEKNITVPSLSDQFLDNDRVTVDEVLAETLLWLKTTEGYSPDYTMFLKATHPFRTSEMIDILIQKIILEKIDTVMMAKKEFKTCWRLNNGKFISLDEGFVPLKIKQPTWIAYTGLGIISRTSIIEAKKRLGEHIAMINIDDTIALLDIVNPSERMIAKQIFKEYTSTEHVSSI